jgi:hypothetical protein
VSALPLFVLWYFLSQNVTLKELGQFLISLKFYGAASLSVVFLYLYAQVIRITSKYYENKYFVDDSGFPTTYLLTYADKTFSSTYKDRFRTLIQKHFDLRLPSETEEHMDIAEARRRIAEAVKLVTVKVGDGKLVKKHNIWYGFFRNLIGGSLYSMLFSSVNIVLGFCVIGSPVLTGVSMVLLLLYLVIFFLRKRILSQNGEAYAKQLLSEFIAQN